MRENQSPILAPDPTSDSLYDFYRDLGLATAMERSGDPTAEKASAPAALRLCLDEAKRTNLDPIGKHLTRNAGQTGRLIKSRAYGAGYSRGFFAKF